MVRTVDKRPKGGSGNGPGTSLECETVQDWSKATSPLPSEPSIFDWVPSSFIPGGLNSFSVDNLILLCIKHNSYVVIQTLICISLISLISLSFLLALIYFTRTYNLELVRGVNHIKYNWLRTGLLKRIEAYANTHHIIVLLLIFLASILLLTSFYLVKKKKKYVIYATARAHI